MAAAKMKLRQREKSTPGKASASVVISAEASPDSKCPICLDRFNNMAYLDLCLHKFCFRCIHEWSKNKAECPLCKQPFNSIYHTIKSESDFKKYDLRPSDNGSFGNFGGERFRYRTTLTGAQHQAQRRTASPPDNGVMFEGPSGGPGPARQDRGLRRMMMKLAARRRAEDEGRTVRSLREQEMVKFRRALYRRGVRVRSVRDGGRSRDTSAEFFQRNPACLHRLVPFLKRELMVLYGAHGSLVNIVQHIIMSRITRYDMEDRAIEEELHPFLQSRTEHFLHEFLSFARAPFNMEAYDEHAVYDCPAPSSHDDSSSNSSVIAISEEEDSVDLDPPADSMSSGALSQTPWDDETPGPSYSTTTEATRLSVQDSESESNVEEGVECGAVQKQRTPRVKADVPQVKTDKDACVSSGDEDCVIVGFVKPLVERTPELVHLSSESEESVHEEIKDVPRLPQHIRFASLSPPSSPRQGKSEVTETERNISGSKEKRNTSGRQEASSKSSSRNKGRHDRDGRRHHSRDRSRERDRQRSKSRERRRRSPSADHSHSIRSPAISINSDSTLFKGRRQSRSPSRDCSKWDTWEKKRDKDGSRSGSRHSTTSHSYHWHYYSQEREKESSTTLYTERRSYYSSSHRNPERHDSHSRSQSRSQSRERRRSRTRSCSPSKSSPTSHRKSRHEKPSGKRKYKTRHLEDPADDLQTAMAAPSKPQQQQPELPSPSSSSLGAKDKKKSKEKHRKTSKEKSDRAKRSRSLSVEIVYEGGSTTEQTKKHHKKKKKKHKKKRHRSKERLGRHSPTVITIDSDSDHHATVEDANQACPVSTSSDGLIVKGTTTGNPSDSSLLESMLQDWEQQVQPPVALDNGFSVSKPSTSPPPSAKASDNDIDKCDVKHSEDVQAPSTSKDKANSLSPANASASHSTDGS